MVHSSQGVAMNETLHWYSETEGQKFRSLGEAEIWPKGNKSYLRRRNSSYLLPKGDLFFFKAPRAESYLASPCVPWSATLAVTTFFMLQRGVFTMPSSTSVSCNILKGLTSRLHNCDVEMMGSVTSERYMLLDVFQTGYCATGVGNCASHICWTAIPTIHHNSGLCWEL